ncbi:MAG TPA: NAD(+) diphosphatase [Actinomycetales bacterium]|nr:NAD(+) diphosphatase [Actinomycetales bacterium]
MPVEPARPLAATHEDRTAARPPLAHSAVDRAAELRGPGLVPQLLVDAGTRVLTVSDGRALVVGDPAQLVLRDPQPADRDRLAMFLGRQDDVCYLAVVVPDDLAAPDVVAMSDAPAGPRPPGAPGGGGLSDTGEGELRWAGLREVGVVLPDRDAALVTQALALANWHATHTHCPRCGSPTRVAESGYVRVCETDGSEHYPRTDPAVIMTVVDDEGRLLLGRQVTWPEGRFSTLAGFVEPGENLEAAVRREVREESGLVVDDVRYLGSQPWPFPASIMVGFTAHAVTTDVHVDGVELGEARWFTREQLYDALSDGSMRAPNRLSIARFLIEEWYGEPLGDLGSWR